MAPATKPDGREDATPRYGNGSVKRNTDIGTAFFKDQNDAKDKYLSRTIYQLNDKNQRQVGRHFPAETR